MRYWIDDFGRLWQGPCANADNLHWATFDGYMSVPPYSPIWVLRRSSKPDDLCEITKEEALKAALMHWTPPPPQPADIENY